MPLFYFDLVDGFHSGDEEGTELEGAVEARVEAVKLAGAFLRECSSLLWRGEDFRVLVFDEARTLLTTVLVTTSDSPTMEDRLKAESGFLH